MSENPAIAIVGLGAILPDAPDVQTFWKNIQASRYSITDVASDRWRAELFYNPDPSAPDKTYSKVGGWVRGFTFEPARMGIAIPPRIQEQIDEVQQWAISACYQALKDYGYPSRFLDPNRVAVILGNAMGGEKHYLSTIRIHLPEYIDSLSSSPAFKNLAPDVQSALVQGLSSGVHALVPSITEDTMPGELSNIIAGRVANVFNFTGPNYVTDAACASSLAALQSAVDGLRFGQFDAVLTGGVDRSMGVESFVKFSKIGALSPDGSRPYAEGANGFVMGEGTAIFLLKRLEDAERDGDKIYAVIRAIGGSSDGKGKGITAPNPLGQQRAIQRAWKNAAIPLSTVGLIEGHGTSTPVGDLAEVSSLNIIFGQVGLKPGSVALGSVKSNFGHLKSAAGAAGLLKAALALYDHILPPSVNFNKPNSKIDFSNSPFYVNTQTHPWEVPSGEVRRAGVSAFGFGGTNFHVILEEYLPGMLTKESAVYPGADLQSLAQAIPVDLKPYRGLLFVGAESASGLTESLVKILHQAKLGHLPENTCPTPQQLGQPERLVIDYENLKEFVPRAEKALKALESDSPAGWQALGVQSIYRGSGRPGKVAFLFPGQGSQYVNMLRDLRTIEPLVAETFREADAIMTPILGRPISSYVFVDGKEDAISQAELRLRSTEITQPALLAVHVSMLRVLAKYGFKPDLVIGHSLGEYAALVAAGILNLSEALQVVSARGQEMAKVAADDNGCMAAVSAPLGEVERILKSIPGYVVIANINSPVQCVIGGETAAVDAAIRAFLAEGLQATKIAVSHAFHTRIVAPASQPLRKVIARMNIQAPTIPIVANVTGKPYPTDREGILDILAAQVASPVQFVQGVNALYEQGARIFVEVGPKRVLSGLVADILKEHKDINVFSTNHPRKGDLPSFNEALGRLYAAGVNGITAATIPVEIPPAMPVEASQPAPVAEPASVEIAPVMPVEVSQPASVAEPASIEKTSQIPTPIIPAGPVPADEGAIMDGRLPITGSVVISGAGLGLPGRGKHVFDDANILDILHGQMRIEPLPDSTRQGMLDKRPTRLVKSEAGAIMQTIDDMELTLKLAGQRGTFDPASEFGMPKERLEAIDISTQLAIAAGIEALRDAGIPLVMAYKPTSTGSYLPDHWKLPEPLADETGIIFASAFPGLDRMADEADKFYQNQMVAKQIEELRHMAALVPAQQIDLKASFEKRIAELEAEAARLDYHFDRRYVFRVLTMGHSQFAEYIGARGPNTHVNAACASTTHAVAIAEDWIRLGRARRVIIVAGDDVISGSLSQWIGTSLMASGAATPEGNLRLAALPFDRRRNGMIIGMGAAALVVESEDAVRERGMRAICEVLSTTIANSAYHGTRLNVYHVSQVMETLLKTAEGRFGISRSQIAAETMFVSHETYTPARGGSAAAEIHALRDAFGPQANQVIIANTKGFTGHTMGVGVEDVVAVKALEFGIVPPIANIQEGFEPDPELGDLNLSHGGPYPLQYSLRLGAGFGSQIAMTLLRKIPGQGERVDQASYNRWLSQVSGYATTELEVSQRTLHIKNQGVPTRKPSASRWQYGQGPTLWADKLASVSNATVSLPLPAGLPVAAQPVEVSPQPVAAQAIEPGAIQAFVLAMVSEKTGYPIEVLALDLDLEADLGIDTVKQAELFVSIRTQYGIPRREDLRLSDYNTLAKVIAFVKDSLGSVSTSMAETASQPASMVITPALEKSPEPAPVQALVKAPVQAPAAIVPAAAQINPAEIKAYVLAAVSEKTGYPQEVLDLELDLEADLGIDTVKQAELFVAIRTQYGIARREDLRLSDYNTLAKVIRFVEDSIASTPAAPAPVEPAAEAATPAADAIEPIKSASPAIASFEEIKTYLLAAVSEKTGYPQEVLDLDLDLEADLGIDTVKQAELFAAIREQYGIARREDLRLSDYNTLAKVIRFVEDSIASTPAASAPVEPAAETAAPVAVAIEPIKSAAPAIASFEEIKTYLLAAVSEKTGYPPEVLDLNLDLEADLGIDTVKQAELFAAIREQYGIARREDLRLSDYNTLAKVIHFVEDALRPATTTAVADISSEPPAVAAIVPPEAPAIPVATPSTALPLPMSNDGDKATVSAEPVDELQEIKTYVLTIVSEKTGYPFEVLDLNLDLEADLGIDTVKQAELFASIREHFDFPRREDLRLSEYNTLAKVMAFVEGELKARKEAALQAANAAPVQVETPAPDESEAPALIVRRAPLPALRPRLDLCIPTGVELAQGQRVLVVENKPETAEALVRSLMARKVEPLRLSARLTSAEISTKMSAWLAEGPIAGVYFLPALEIEPGLAEMNLRDWQAGLEERLYCLFTIMKALPEETFLVCATRLGGLHGYSAEGASAPLGGAVSGFAKAVAREREQAFVKIVDFETSATPAVIASRLIGETLQDPGALEIGWEKDLRYGIATLESPLPAENNFALEPGSVFLVSGGSGGIIRPIVEDLARATQGHFYLLDRVPIPAADDPDIQRLASDREGLKNELITRLTRDGKRPTPVQVEGALFGIERAATTLQTLGIIEQLGGQAHYLACDVTDPVLIDEAIQKIKDAEGHIDAFLHAAGMERSRKLEMKPIEEFRLVVSVKADGFFNLFKAMQAKDMLPRGIVFFSSVAGRFGNSGQTDYAAANDLLCKVASALRNQYPGLKAVAIDWSAWGGVGMATRGNIPTLMKMAGIDLVPFEQAAPMVRAELLASHGEAIIAGSLGMLLEARSPHGGMDLAKADSALRSGQPIHSMLSHVADFDLNRGLTLEAELDPKAQPYLYDHSMNGIPVLPGVMGIEGFSVAAKHIGSVLASSMDGLEVDSLEDIHFLAAFKFYRKEPRRVTWLARAVREQSGLVVYVSLESSRLMKTGAEKHMQHFSGKVHLKPHQAEAQEASAAIPIWNGSYTVQAADIYQLYFHGPAFQVLEGVQRSGDAVLGKLNKQLPAFTNDGHGLLSTPTLVELCFQTAGIWEIGKTGVMALPRSIQSLTLYRQNVNGAAIYAEVKPYRSGNGELHFDARVVDSKGRLYLELKEYTTTPLPVSVQPDLLAPLQELMKDS